MRPEVGPFPMALVHWYNPRMESTQPAMTESAQTSQVDTALCAAMEAVRARIRDAAQRAGRDPNDVLLVAVSKTHPIEAIVAALGCGQVDFGENRLEELEQKLQAAESLGIASRLRWHFIGPIQSRKIKQALGPWSLIHAVDRLKIARLLSRHAESEGRRASILLEVNVSGEESKHGFTPDELRAALPELLALDGLDIQGFMTMAPFVDDPEEARPVFRSLRTLRDALATATGRAFPHLSMGMTNDFEVAIEEGATLVRIGTAIFGARS